jgi:hypothetical protein
LPVVVSVIFEQELTKDVIVSKGIDLRKVKNISFLKPATTAYQALKKSRTLARFQQVLVANATRPHR